MIIELQNFGPIKSFKFDTDKDIHAIFGKNNIGKSYAISAVYLILKGLMEQIDIVPNEADYTGPVHLLEKNGDIYKYESKEEGVLNHLKKTFLSNLNKSFINTFDISILKNTLSGNQRLNIKIYSNDFILELVLLNNESKLIISEIEFGKYIIIDSTEQFNQVKLFNDANILLERSDIFFGTPQVDIFHLKFKYFKSLIKRELSNIYYLPASRSGLYNSLNSFGAIFAEISRYRLSTNAKFEIPNLSEPISDYFLNLNSINNNIISKSYVVDFSKIERKILKGNISFDNDTKKYFYTPINSDIRLELSKTSSMISEIAPIIAHLKYIIPLQNETPSILFIEEPEAHLHPEIQILLLEYFVKLSKENLKIVMTSHSNYIFNKLSNMVISKEISPDRLSVSLMKMTPEGSVVEEGAMHMDEYGIEDDNFVDVAEQLYEERMKLLENINE
ncbi:MAG: AAA family ATPase [Arcicella sp.]|jgi:predicted ATPase|nr:AAA family ATPase [Arcicella sp.]